MNPDTSAQSGNTITVEDYSRAMNIIGQSLLSTLTQILEKLPQELRNKKVVTQGLSAFLANVIHKQSPDNQDLCKEMLAELTDFVLIQLENVPQSV
jgi:hypothetical protein